MMDATLKLPQYDHTILIVDDDPPSLGVIYGYLEEHGFEIMVATDGELALQRAEKGQPDIILLDILMPGMDGYEICRRLKENKLTQDIPVIFLTALGSTTDKVKGFTLGGVDYITKPLDNEEVLARVLTQLKIRDLTRELERTCNEQERHIQERTAELAKANEELKAEIAERKHKEALINLRLELIYYADDHSLEEVFVKALDEVEELTRSKISFYHFVDDEKKTVQLQAWSTRTVDQFCNVKGKDMHYPLDQAGVWVECVYKRQAVIHNDYKALPNKKGLPEGHAPIKRELVVPVFRENRIVAILGVGNKSNAYNQKDISDATYCADVVWEITQRKRTEADLRDSEERYRNLFEYSPISLFEQDFSFVKQKAEKFRREGVEDFRAFFREHPEIVTKCLQHIRLTDANKAGLQMYEATCKADLEKGLQQLIPPDAYHFVSEALIWIAEGKTTYEWECINTTLSGRRISINIGCSVVPGYEDTYSKVLVFVRDITESKKLAELREKNQQDLEAQVKARTTELAAAKEQAEVANATKSDFLARMSHEIRTPLNAVTGLTNIMLKSSLTVEQRDYLNKIQIAASNLLEVINDILDFSKVEAGRLELSHTPFDLSLVLEQLADLFSNRLTKKDIELVFTSAAQVRRQLIGDAGRLTQILTNLVGNAVKFTESGEIVVSVDIDEPIDRQAGQIVLQFKVSDTGSGIAAGVLPTLFDPFTQADGYLTRNHEGTGLGLAICRRLVELMEGRIWAESEPGRGSTFSFTVRLEAQQEDKAPLRLPPDLYGLRTLVVDDNATARQMLVGLLESFTFNVTAVESGEKAIEMVRQTTEEETFNVVLLDWKMPGIDGPETARHIRELGLRKTIAETSKRQQPETTARYPASGINSFVSPTPIIAMVSPYGHELIDEQFDKSTIDAFLVKPIKSSQLLKTILELLGRPEAALPGSSLESTTLPALWLSGNRILAVEDSELNREVVITLLEELGVTVDTAENGQIAVDKITHAPSGTYDAILMDIQMPIMDGYEATRRIRDWEFNIDTGNGQKQTHIGGTSSNGAQKKSTISRIPIIALTAHVLKGEKEKCLAADMDDYLAKPLDEKKLHRVLNRWIASKGERQVSDK